MTAPNSTFEPPHPNDGATSQCDAVEELVATYLAALQKTNGRRDLVSWQGQQALVTLVELLRPVVHGRVRKMVFNRFGTRRGGELLPDFLAEADLLIVKAAGDYDLERGGRFRPWVLSHAGPLLCGIRELMETMQGGGAFTAGERVVLRYAAAVLSEISDVDGRYDRQELYQRVRAGIFLRARTTAQKALRSSKAQLSEAQWVEAVGQRAQQRLRKDGVLAALNQLDVLLAQGLGGEVLLSAGGDEDGELGDVLAANEQVEDVADLGDDCGPGVSDLMLVGLTPQEKVQVGSEAGDVKWLGVRMQAPHVQFAALSPTVAR